MTSNDLKSILQTKIREMRYQVITSNDLKSIFQMKIREMMTEIEATVLPLSASFRVDFITRDEILVEDVMKESDKNVFYIKVRVR